jgi:signal transduction histidine kinase
MRIKTRLRINSAIAFVLMLVMVFFFVQFRQQAVQTDRNLDLVEEMRKIAFERMELRDEYLANQSERAKLLWEKKTERFRLLLEEVKGSFMKPADSRTIEGIGEAFQGTIPLFYRLAEISERESNAHRDQALFGEGQKRLMSQILLKVHVQMDQINALRESVKRASDSAHDNLHLLFIICVAAFVLVTIGNSIVLNNLLAKRVGALRKGTEIIGDGNLDYRIDVPGNDELSELARKSNDMAAKLRDSYTSMENLQREIAGRMRAEEDIQMLNRELEQRVRDRTAQLDNSNKELESFAYSVSHDLRAPLRGIDGWSLALIEDYGERLDERAHGYLRRVRAETQQMGRLIDDLLKLSRVTRAEMQKVQVNLTAMARGIADSLQEERPERRIEFIIQPELRADGDGPLLEIALTNLLDNAVKFTGKRALARIEFGETEADGGKAFFVRDNGVGFDMAYGQKLFGAFQRLHKSSEFPGTGIGLATVQRIIHRHGGRIWAEAKLDQGAVFYFTLKEVV